ncbi:MAG: S41 family peptidase, partial [Cyclobacteriaceae bacterium]
GKEVKDAVIELKGKGATGIILDLRDNPGGLVFEAVNICNIFIPKGKRVVITKGKVQNSNASYETLNNPVDLEIPLVVLINRGSASASEIVAGTLQDYDRAVIVGEKSFGKGLVQIPRPLSYNSQVKITTAKYYTPSGRCIQVLDYSHRREDGSVGSIPDSLKKIFKTSTGRAVYDGGGIDPDIVLDGSEISSFTQMLYNNGFIFDYATLYASEKQHIPPARDFKLSDGEYDEFVRWVKSKQYNYRSPVEVQLSVFEQQAKREKYYGDLKTQIGQIGELLSESRKKDLYNFKDQIKTLLEQDIVSRYYLEKGSTEVRFKNDMDIKKSIEILNSPADYKKVLNI